MKRKPTQVGAWLAFMLLGGALCALAYLRGEFLLGRDYGAAYAVIAAGLLWCFARAFTQFEKPSYARAGAIAALSLPLGFVLAYPATVSHDVQILITDQAVDRKARAELAALFASDPAYAKLWTSTAHLKVVNVTIHGTLRNRADLTRLRVRIDRECPTLELCPLHWEVTTREPEERIKGLDSQLFKPDRSQPPES